MRRDALLIGLLIVFQTACGTPAEKEPLPEPDDNVKADAGADMHAASDADRQNIDSDRVDPDLVETPLPCLTVAPPGAISFATTRLGESEEAVVTVTNCAEAGQLRLDIETCTDDGGDCVTTTSVFSANATQLTLEPLQSRDVVISFTPVAAGDATGLLSITSEQLMEQPQAVTLSGAGVEDCPRAVAQVRPAGTTQWLTTEFTATPLTSLEFRGTSSVATDGTIERYEWTLVQRPVGSTARFASPNEAEPTLFLDLVEDYVVELKVFDDEGNESCGDPALITVHAVPVQDIYLQLTWDTPADADQTDGSGNDLDLHFLHPNGTWNNLPYDIFWNNPTSDWGTPGAEGDPSFQVEDSDGAGPEVISLDDPENAHTYAVGVYYYDAQGYGPANASLRVYVRGQKEFEQLDKPLPGRGIFWSTATIAWPFVDVVPIDQVQQGFPSAP